MNLNGETPAASSTKSLSGSSVMLEQPSSSLVSDRIRFFGGGGGGSSSSSISCRESSASLGEYRNSSEITTEDEEEEEDDDEDDVEDEAYPVAKEICSSEREYVTILKLLNVHFREHVRKRKALSTEELNKVLCNLSELLILNSDLLFDFEKRVENWSKTPKIADVMVNKGKFLLIYTTYIKEFPEITSKYIEYLAKSSEFSKCVQEFQSREECKNLKIEHFMLKPVQRLPQYKLLFERYLKRLRPTHRDYKDAVSALQIIKDTADKANAELKENDSFNRMLTLQSRVNLPDLIQPDRDIIKEGELMKLSRNSVDPRYIVLLTDCLLYTTYSAAASSLLLGDLKIRYKIPLHKLRVVDLSEETDRNYDDDDNDDTDFKIISNIRSCVLRAESKKVKQEWLHALNSAIYEFRFKRSTFAQATIKDQGAIQGGAIGSTAPVWIPDKKASMCQSCTVEFSVLIRRHHCRGCGIIICFQCSGNRAPLKYLNNKQERVCDDCFDTLIEGYYYEDAKCNNDLIPLFKRRDKNPSMARNVPSRLKMSANAEDAQAAGYLRKRVVKSGKWKKMWFVLKDSVLYAYKAPGDQVAVDTFPVLGFGVEIVNEKLGNQPDNDGDPIFQLTHEGLERYSLCFKARNKERARAWIQAFEQASVLK